MKKRRVRIAVICAAFVLYVCGYIFYRPIPVIEEKYMEEAEVTWVVRWLGGTKQDNITEYNEEELIHYLNTCKMRRSLFVTQSRMLDDYKMTIFVHYPGGSRQIWIGEDYNICIGLRGGRYRIRNAQEVLATLLGYIETE